MGWHCPTFFITTGLVIFKRSPYIISSSLEHTAEWVKIEWFSLSFHWSPLHYHRQMVHPITTTSLVIHWRYALRSGSTKKHPWWHPFSQTNSWFNQAGFHYQRSPFWLRFHVIQSTGRKTDLSITSTVFYLQIRHFAQKGCHPFPEIQDLRQDR